LPKITKRTVDGLKPDPGKKDVFTWDAGDGAIKGFGVRMKPSGSAAYLVQYRNKEGRTRRLVLGKVGVLTPDEARELATDALRAAAKGGDPSAERRAIRNSITVAELCDLYLSEAAGRIKASTLAMDKSRIETHVKPLIGRLTVRSLTTADIERMKADIIAGKTARPRKERGRGGKATGGVGVAARTVGMVGTILEHARQPLKLIRENPARGVRRPPDGRQRRFLSLPELRKLGETIRELEGPAENKAALAAIRLLLLTGFRRMEALALPAEWVDTRARCVRFGDTKSGAQLRPIGAKAVAVVEAQTKGNKSKWVFPASAGDNHFVGLPRVLARVCAKAKLAGVTVHVLRHTFAATAAEMGFSELTIAGLLGHSVPGVTARYAHVPDSALLSAADRVSARIAAALDGLPEADVRPFPAPAAA
jgi:integrase